MPFEMVCMQTDRSLNHGNGWFIMLTDKTVYTKAAVRHSQDGLVSLHPPMQAVSCSEECESKILGAEAAGAGCCS